MSPLLDFLVASLLALLLLAGPTGALAQAPAPSGAGSEAGEAWTEPPPAGEPSVPPDTQAAGIDARLSARAEALYRFLEGKRVNLYSLYTDETFRDFFTTEEALGNYVAYLTDTLARRRFRKYRIDRTEFLGFTPEGPGEVRAELKVIGRHVHLIFFWDVTETIENDWKLVDGEWFVFPPPF